MRENLIWGGVLAFVLAAVVAFSADSALAGIGKIKTMKGEVLIIRDGKKIISQPGDDVEQADVIVTGPDSSVGITFIDKTVFSAGPESRIEITRFRFSSSKREKNEFHSSLKRGTLSIISGRIAKQGPGAMTVKTPASILGVRGTRFLIKVEE
jgi:hypothetical protein